MEGFFQNVSPRALHARQQATKISFARDTEWEGRAVDDKISFGRGLWYPGLQL
jgi:hypothetical protein